MKVLGLLLELRPVAMSIRFVSDVGSTSVNQRDEIAIISIIAHTGRSRTRKR